MNQMLNKEMLVEALKEYRYEDACYDGEKPSPLETWEDVHDACLFVFIGDIRIEDHAIMYGEMLSIINNNWEDIANDVNEYLDEELQPCYMGEPAFASASDYWRYIMG